MSLSSCNRSLLLLPCLLLAACANDHGPAEEQTNVMEAGKAYSLSVDASKEGSATRALSFDDADKSLSASWARGEKVYACDRGDISFAGFIQPLQEGAVARLNGSISPSCTLSLPIDLYLLFPRKEWNYTGQKGTLSDIAANYDYASAPVSLYKLTESSVGSAQSATFSNQQAVVKLSLHDASGSPLSASSLRVSARGLVQSVSVSHSGAAATTTGSATYSTDNACGDITITPTAATPTFWAALRGVESAPVVSLTTDVGGVTYVYRRTTPTTFAHGKPYVITVKMKPLTEGTALDDVTADHVGCVVGQDGKIYTTTAKAASAGTTAVAMIAYVGSAANCAHGLAIALADEQGAMTQDAAREAASQKNACRRQKLAAALPERLAVYAHRLWQRRKLQLNPRRGRLLRTLLQAGHHGDCHKQRRQPILDEQQPLYPAFHQSHRRLVAVRPLRRLAILRPCYTALLAIPPYVGSLN